jgi:hypothetical protein
MLMVSEETLLLLYARVRPLGSQDAYDSLAIYGREQRPLAGAALMDLVLLGKVQVRSVSPTTRRLLATTRFLFSLLLVTLFFVALVFVPPSRMSLPAWLTPAAAFTLAVILVFLFAGVSQAGPRPGVRRPTHAP